MKKIIALLLVLVMLLSLTACAEETPQDSTGGTTAQPGESKPAETDPTEMDSAQPTDSKPTEPPATEPPATEPPATEPPATEPPATEPPATEPPATEPPATEPPATEPSATEPPATEPPATEPPATEPPATEPPATEPPATEPPATEPPVTEPETVTIYVTVNQRNQYIVGEQTQTIDYQYTLDESGRPVSFVYTDAEGTIQAQGTIEYGDNGLLSRQTIVMGTEEGVVTATYDDQDRIICLETTADGVIQNRITYTYGDTDQPLTMETVAYTTNFTNRYEYTYEGERRTQEVNYQNGELASTVNYEYDDQDRITKAVQLQPDGSVLGESIYTYSADGLTCTIENPGYKRIQVWDEHGNLLSNTLVYGESNIQVTTYEYVAVEVPADDPRAK